MRRTFKLRVSIFHGKAVFAAAHHLIVVEIIAENHCLVIACAKPFHKLCYGSALVDRFPTISTQQVFERITLKSSEKRFIAG